MKSKWLATTIGLLLIFGISILTSGVINIGDLRLAPANIVTFAQSAQDQPMQNDAAQLIGNYSGAVKLNVTVAGVYSDTLKPPDGAPATPELGSIDLSLQLEQSANSVSGYVNLDKTLVYSVEHSLGTGAASVKIGPYVSGSFDGTNLTLQSEKTELSVSGRTVQRQFRLVGTSTDGNGEQVSGEFRETLWGYTSSPVTVIGSFTLQRPGFDDTLAPTSNQVPNVVADTATTMQNSAITINVLANDTDPNGGVLTITSVSKPQFGTVTTNGTTVTYTPNANFVGIDTFSYVVSDGQGGLVAGSVTVTINGPGGPNQSPTATNDAATTTSGNAVTIDILANDGDLDGDALSITIDGPPSHGTATVDNGKVIYTSQSDFIGTDSFTYVISDDRGGTATATVTVTVTDLAGTSPSLSLPFIRGGGQ